MKKVLYECDPRKHKECLKLSCFKYDGPCRRTEHPEYAVQDEYGNPVVAEEWRPEND